MLILTLYLMPPAAGNQKKPGKTAVQKREIPHKKIFEGVTSYYSNNFHGRKMSNGDTYSKYRLTAASNKIPLNKWIRVTNLRNHLSVIVRVTDRMHPRNGLLLDLSYAAAKEIRMTGLGKIKVRVEILSPCFSPERDEEINFIQ